MTEISGHHCSMPLWASYYIHNFTMMGTQVYKNTLGSSVIGLGIFSLDDPMAWNFPHVNANHSPHSQKYTKVRSIEFLFGESV